MLIQPILFDTCYLPGTFMGSQDKMVSKKDTVTTKEVRETDLN